MEEISVLFFPDIGKIFMKKDDCGLGECLVVESVTKKLLDFLVSWLIFLFSGCYRYRHDAAVGRPQDPRDER